MPVPIRVEAATKGWIHPKGSQEPWRLLPDFGLTQPLFRTDEMATLWDAEHKGTNNHADLGNPGMRTKPALETCPHNWSEEPVSSCGFTLCLAS